MWLCVIRVENLWARKCDFLTKYKIHMRFAYRPSSTLQSKRVLFLEIQRWNIIDEIAACPCASKLLKQSMGMEKRAASRYLRKLPKRAKDWDVYVCARPGLREPFKRPPPGHYKAGFTVSGIRFTATHRT